MANFLKKYLVLILCGIVVLGALGTGVWFLVNPDQPGEPDNSETTESIGELNPDTDTGSGDLGSGSGIVNIPNGDTPSGEVTPITPGDKDEAGSSEGNQNASDSGGNESGILDMTGGITANPFK